MKIYSYYRGRGEEVVWLCGGGCEEGNRTKKQQSIRDGLVVDRIEDGR